MRKTAVYKWLFTLLCIFGLIVISNLVLAFDIGDFFGGDKKKNAVASIDLAQMEKSLDNFRTFDEQTTALEEEYSKFAQEVLSEQKQKTDAMMLSYQQDTLGLDGRQRADKLEEYKDKAAALARENQQRLDAKRKEIDGEKALVDQHKRALARKMVKDVAKKKGYTIVIEKKVTIYVKNDITQDVITAVQKESRPKFLGMF